MGATRREHAPLPFLFHKGGRAFGVADGTRYGGLAEEDQKQRAEQKKKEKEGDFGMRKRRRKREEGDRERGVFSEKRGHPCGGFFWDLEEKEGRTEREGYRGNEQESGITQQRGCISHALDLSEKEFVRSIILPWRVYAVLLALLAISMLHTIVLASHGHGGHHYDQRNHGPGSPMSFQCPSQCSKRCSKTQHYKPCTFFC
ncbi:Gibberellin-regulated protein 4 [Vitis vinifera]|uniref:Gibberellin-regulated protein 4 n=1 Tax=Vitis vinifera TaxID=29760 RepID=A0A438IC29_VITVI|nr:Gibberellin-regulated protein 4 [Vitis vinifera]